MAIAIWSYRGVALEVLHCIIASSLHITFSDTAQLVQLGVATE